MARVTIVCWLLAGAGSATASIALWPQWDHALALSGMMMYSAYLISGGMRRQEVVLGPVPVNTADSTEWRWAVVALGMAGLAGGILRTAYLLA